MAKNEVVKKLIQEMVRKEVQTIVPQLVKEIFGNMILEAAKTTTIVSNSHKRRSLQEASFSNSDELDEYPTMPVNMNAGRPQIDRGRLAEMMGYGDFTPSGGQHTGEMIVTHAITDNGTPIPVDPRQLPDHVVHALTRDYRDVMKALDRNKNG